MSSTLPETEEHVTDVEALDEGAPASPPLGDDETLPAPIEHILERLPPEDRVKAAIVMRQTIAQYAGPVPHSGEMRRYKEIDPSFPERFVAMAERQSAHRQELETKILDFDFKVKRRGQDYAMAATVLGLVFALIFALIGAVVVAGIVGGTTVVGVVTAFVAGRVIETKSAEKGAAVEEDRP